MPDTCKHLPEITRLSGAEQPLPPPLAAHAATCAECMGLLMTAAIHQEASTAEVPPAALVFRKAELANRRAMVEHAQWPIRLAETFGLLVLFIAAIATAAWSHAGFAVVATLLLAVAAAGSAWVLSNPRR